VADEPEAPPGSLYQDDLSFRRPLAEAIAECQRTFVNASTRVAGAEPRVRAAIDALQTLRTFTDAVEHHLRERSFRSLPGVTSAGQRLDACHHQLNVGPWRGVFLVSADGAQVVALLFSRAPHTLDHRLGELVATHAPKGREGASPRPGG
jgi:hypothetical protein